MQCLSFRFDPSLRRGIYNSLGIVSPHYEVGLIMYSNPQNLKKFKKFDSIEV